MTDETPAAQDLDDARVLNLVRAGDANAFGLLYQRHEQAARRLARELVVSPAEVDDVVAETFARLLDVTQRGGGPSDAFRPYVLTAVRRVCYDRLSAQRGQNRAAELAMPDPGDPFVDTAVASLDRSLIARAFLSLPERWSAVLWHADIERGSLSEVTAIFGLTRNGVSALRQHAKDGLRQAYLQMYISRLTRPECESVSEQLSAFVRDALPGRETTIVSAHLSQCEECQAVCTELADVDTALRDVVAPIFLGSAAAPYLASAVHGAAAAGAVMPVIAGAHGGAGGLAAGASTGGSGAGASAGGSGAGAGAGGGFIASAMAGATAAGAGGDLVRSSAGPVTGSSATSWGPGSPTAFGPGGLLGASPARHGPRPLRWLAAGTGIVVAVFAIAFAVLLTGSSAPGSPAGPARHQPQAAARLSPASIATSSQPKARRKTPARAASHSPSAAASPPASPKPQPAVSPPSVDRSPSVQLAATVNVNGGHYGDHVVFQVMDAGSAATGQLTATITLPGGASMTTGGDGGGQDRTATDGGSSWSCQPTSTGAICTHHGISAGGQTWGTIFITLSGTAACGQPVQLTAGSGSASASAQSPSGIAC
ncbi:MAG TPA: sigma-70 family RNA polymerase sigma factor [Streptosporangiaceae bacterium]